MSPVHASCDSMVTLFFDGLEIIFFKDEDGGKCTGVVLLPNRSDHVPNLDIFRIVDNISVPIPHEIDITRGLTIALQGAPHSGVSRRDNSFERILNLQGDDFHKGHLKFNMECHHHMRSSPPPITIEVSDGAFFTAAYTEQPLVRFDVTGKLPDVEIRRFADVVGADIELSPRSSVVIRETAKAIGRCEAVDLPYVSGTRYAVVIKNSPAPGHHHPPLPSHVDPFRREVTHFYFYYELVDDDRVDKKGRAIGPRFDLAVLKGAGVPPQNCDPVILDPPPPG